MLGKDVERNEYWIFKEEPTKVFVKIYENVESEEMQIDEGIDEIKKALTYEWCYYDEEEEYEKLIEACNTKGIREKKL